MAGRRKTRRPQRPLRKAERQTPAGRLAEAEALYTDFVALTPYRFRPFVRSFDSFDDYHRWRRAQTNPWYR
jgi:hypothetical protein